MMRFSPAFPLIIGVLCACTTTLPPAPALYEPARVETRNPLEAQKLSSMGAERLATQPQAAERYFRRALTHDLYFGPAHNNLGVLYLNRGMLYEAANEFEWARKLMPGHPDPRMNLGLTLERAARTDEALKAYASALEVYKEHIPTMQAIARLSVQRGVRDGESERILKEIALQGETEEWREWAQQQLLRFTDATTGISAEKAGGP